MANEIYDCTSTSRHTSREIGCLQRPGSELRCSTFTQSQKTRGAPAPRLDISSAYESNHSLANMIITCGRRQRWVTCIGLSAHDGMSVVALIWRGLGVQRSSPGSWIMCRLCPHHPSRLLDTAIQNTGPGSYSSQQPHGVINPWGPPSYLHMHSE